MAGDVAAALRTQNVQVSAGVPASPPVANPSAFQINVKALGRLVDPSQFADIIIKSDNEGRVTGCVMCCVELAVTMAPTATRIRAPRSDPDLPPARLGRTGHRAWIDAWPVMGRLPARRRFGESV